MEAKQQVPWRSSLPMLLLQTLTRPMAVTEVRERLLRNPSKLVPSDSLSKPPLPHRDHLSRTMRRLERQGLVECLTPDRHFGRLYALTQTGVRQLPATINTAIIGTLGREQLSDLAWIVGGSQRRAVLHVFDQPLAPVELWRRARTRNPKISRCNVSDVLRVFRERGIVTWLPAPAKPRAYQLLTRGQAVRRLLVHGDAGTLPEVRRDV